MQKKRILMIVAIVVLLAVVGIAGGVIFTHMQKKEPLEGFQGITSASFSYYQEEKNNAESISIYFNDECDIAFIDMEEYDLNEEQCEQLKELILQYAVKVEEKSEDYWPHTEEYPDMTILFAFEVWDEEKTYREMGALCYPDGWDEFWQELKDIILE